MLNPHQLELFYYVVTHRGISRAVRRMPYGIQQPAVSGQMLQLEQQLRTKLFERAPFRLTAEGEELFAFVRPFFERLDAIETRLRGGKKPHLRIGAAEPVLRDHLPAVLRQLRAAQPRLHLSLRSGYQAQLEDWLLQNEIDLAVMALDGRPAPALRRLVLRRLPLVLLVPRASRLRSTEDVLRASSPEFPLISPPATETISRNFQRGLARRRISWTPAIVASSLETLACFVAEGYGVGVTAAETHRPARVRAIPLVGFDPIELAALWRGESNSVVDAAVAAMIEYVGRRWPAQAPT